MTLLKFENVLNEVLLYICDMNAMLCHEIYVTDIDMKEREGGAIEYDNVLFFFLVVYWMCGIFVTLLLFNKKKRRI